MVAMAEDAERRCSLVAASGRKTGGGRGESERQGRTRRGGRREEEKLAWRGEARSARREGIGSATTGGAEKRA